MFFYNNFLTKFIKKTSHNILLTYGKVKLWVNFLLHLNFVNFLFFILNRSKILLLISHSLFFLSLDQTSKTIIVGCFYFINAYENCSLCKYIQKRVKRVENGKGKKVEAHLVHYEKMFIAFEVEKREWVVYYRNIIYIFWLITTVSRVVRGEATKLPAQTAIILPSRILVSFLSLLCCCAVFFFILSIITVVCTSAWNLPCIFFCVNIIHAQNNWEINDGTR